MIRFFQTKTKSAFNRISQSARQNAGKESPVNAEGVSKKTGGFWKSGAVILGGLYGYYYFTGGLEDINLYHVSFYPTNQPLVHQHCFKNRRVHCSSPSARVSETYFLWLVC
jgi:hypothetical protein